MTADGPDLAYFQRLYATGADPWAISVGFYEQRKREVLLASLPKARFARGFEPGCASGELTVELGRRCEALLAADADPQAVRLTRERLAAAESDAVGPPSVSVQRLVVPAQWPTGSFDLIVLSELGYFMGEVAWAALVGHAVSSLTEHGTVLACHWRHPFAERRSDTAALHEALDRGLRAVGARSALRTLDEDFQLDVWTRAPQSPAERERRR